MQPLLRLLLLLLLASGTGIPAKAGDSPKSLRRDLDKIFADNRFAAAQWGIEVFSLDRSEILYEHNSQRLYIPASNNKILTAAAALTQLGPDYRFKTQIRVDGSVLDGVLKGNLLVVGFGDPSSSSRIGAKDPFHAFRGWASNLKQRGIRAIDGEIIGDGTSFEETGYGQGWEWNDLAEGFAAPVSALQFNENMVALEFAPGPESGSIASLRMTPLADYLHPDNRVVTEAVGGPARIQIEQGRQGEDVIARGFLTRQGGTVNRTVAVQFPVRFYLSALMYALNAEGIDVSRCGIKEMRNARAQSSTMLWTHSSPPLSELLAPWLKMSLNLVSETFVRALGLELRSRATFSKGKEVVEEALGRLGIDKATYSYADGSGLSRLNLVSADALVRILASLHRRPDFALFYDALAIAGMDGTLENRMKGTKAESNVHAKSGTLGGVSALSGYVHTAGREMLAFSFIANNYLGGKDAAEQLQDKALLRLVAFSRKSRGQGAVGGRQ